jgi:peptide/nickel transport system permease protein
MGRYLVRRLLIMIPTLLGISFITLGIAHLAPGDPISLQSDVARAGAFNRDAVVQFRKIMHLDDPLPVQWASWLRRMITLDFDRSLITGRPVIDTIAERLPPTLLLAGLAFLLTYLLAIPLGVLSAARQGTAVDRVATVSLFALYSLPNFWVAIMLMLFLGGGGHGKYPMWFPIQGLVSDEAMAAGGLKLVGNVIWHLVLPVVCLTYVALASVSRYMRTGMLEAIRQDYIRTARAKGLPERAVVLKHALRNSLIPVITLIGLMLPYLVGGSIVIEQIFGIPGMGQLSFEAVQTRDYPVIMAVTALVALVTMLALLFSDVLYSVVDPRIRHP